MKRAADTRTALVEAGRRLALRKSLADVTPLQLSAEAGMGLDAWERHFHNLAEFVTALQQDFMHRLRRRMMAITAGARPGAMRIKLATEAFLECCLAERELRSWLIEARIDATVAEGLRKQNQTYWMIIGTELGNLGWPYPQAAARLYIAMTNEASLAEHRLGQAIPEMRETLWDFLDRGGLKRAAA